MEGLAPDPNPQIHSRTCRDLIPDRAECQDAHEMCNRAAPDRIARYILGATEQRPAIAIVCGSGLSTLSELLENPQTLKYKEVCSRAHTCALIRLRPFRQYLSHTRTRHRTHIRGAHTLHGKIPGWPKATVAGHKGELVFGQLGGHAVVCMRGRFHT